MWEYCGVVKEEEKLVLGLKKIKEIKERSREIDVRISDNNFQDLINTFDLKSSLISAEATILSAKERKESRVSHQRSDYPSINETNIYNCQVSLKDNCLNVSKIKIKNLNQRFSEIIKNTAKIKDYKERLLE